MISDIALKLYAAKREGIIKTNAQFWREFAHVEAVNALPVDPEKYKQGLRDAGIQLTCAFDENFPPLPAACRPSERPYFFAYQGDLSLLQNRAKNVAVVGTLTPTEAVLRREKAAVKALAERGFTIVSGLARGCDTAAHEACLACGGKTVAFLPTPLGDIYPRENRTLAERIVQSGGLVLSEYVTEPVARCERIGRFVARDRLQAMFAGSIVLIASHLPGEGDSGSRHAMDKAKAYGTRRFVLFDPLSDASDPLFALNRQYLSEGAVALTKRTIEGL